ncbi:MAG: hypothetical protein IPG63_17640 [Xanthomonadales bacterium]|nr:hypothetical protein [Xanthomonadales bacterium]
MLPLPACAKRWKASKRYSCQLPLMVPERLMLMSRGAVARLISTMRSACPGWSMA